MAVATPSIPGINAPKRRFNNSDAFFGFWLSVCSGTITEKNGDSTNTASTDRFPNKRESMSSRIFMYSNRAVDCGLMITSPLRMTMWGNGRNDTSKRSYLISPLKFLEMVFWTTGLKKSWLMNWGRSSKKNRERSRKTPSPTMIRIDIFFSLLIRILGGNRCLTGSDPYGHKSAPCQRARLDLKYYRYRKLFLFFANI